MIKFEVFAEVLNEMQGRHEPVTIATWVTVDNVFSVQADGDPAWAMVTFKAGAGRRAMIVHGTAEAVAAAIGTEQDRQRWPARRSRV